MRLAIWTAEVRNPRAHARGLFTLLDHGCKCDIGFVFMDSMSQFPIKVRHKTAFLEFYVAPLRISSCLPIFTFFTEFRKEYTIDD